MSEPRQDKDKNDIHKLLAFQEPRNPFDVDPTLQSIVTGIEANGFANVDQTEQVADKILCDMVDKPVTKYTFRTKSQVNTFGSKSAVRIQEEVVHIHVDPKLLYQRLITAGKYRDDLPDVFENE